MVTILWYSTFTLLCCFSAKVWQLVLFRMLAGMASAANGRWEERWWRRNGRRIEQTSLVWMHTGYYVGFFLAALANYFLGARYGWRVMFAIGGFPALLVGFIRYGVTDWRGGGAKLSR